ncbi:MAG: lysophospholipid acyltransferase family protein [Pseudomonadota bacterium]
MNRINRTGRALATLHYYLVWPWNHKLRLDMACALTMSYADASRLLKHSWILTDQAAFQILCQASSACDTNELIESVTVHHQERLLPLREQRKGALLLGMHMGNSLLAAAHLSRAGVAVRAVIREPHRLPVGHLETSLARIGLRPICMDRADPSKVAIEMLRALRRGEWVFVLMDQGTREGGLTVEFIDKRVNMPTGITRIAQKVGVDVFPINTLNDTPNMVYEIGEPIQMTDDRSLNVHLVSDHMQRQIRQFPHLWGWHHRRWKRYDLIDRRTEPV